MKKMLILVVSMLLILMMLPSSVLAAGGSLDNFQKSRTYTEGRFVDVSSSDWFQENVAAAYEYGLVIGTSDTEFEPGSNLTIAQTITLAARLNNIYYNAGAAFVGTGDEPWYQP